MPPVTGKKPQVSVVAPKATPTKPAAKVTPSGPSQVAANKLIKAQEEAERPVIYPEVEVQICCLPENSSKGIGPITAAQAKELLGWETESEYSARVGLVAKFGEDYALKNLKGEKVRCWNNANNRPFAQAWGETLCQDILQLHWKFNLENIIISKTGLVTSGQHRLIALILASEEWHKQKAHWIDNWPEEPTIEALVAFGGSEAPEVLRTIDNVKPRTLSDVFYTSDLFGKISSTERKECARLLSYATALMWKRTKAADEWTKYQTHSASIDFVERHPKILECTKFIFDEDKDRSLSKLRLSTGHCAALLYLMGSSTTDGEEYHIAMPSKEEGLVSWDNWDKATQFWSLLSNTKDDTMGCVRHALGALVDSDEGLGGRITEKHAVIVKAWLCFVDPDHGPITDDDLKLSYAETADGIRKMAEAPECGGIDLGPGDAYDPDDEAPTPAQIAEAAAKEREARMKEMEEKTRAAKKAAPVVPTPKPALPAASTHKPGTGPVSRKPPVKPAAPTAKPGVSKPALRGGK